MADQTVAEKPASAKAKRSAKNCKTFPRLQITTHKNAARTNAICSSSLDAFGVVGRELGEADRERFVVLHLSSKNRILAKETISIGSLNASIVHPREVFRGAVLNCSAAIVLAHNHPSGDPAPSKEDVEITKRLVEAGALLGIRVFDHIIVGGSWYYSFADRDALPQPVYSWADNDNDNKKCDCRKDFFNISERLDKTRDKLSLLGCINWEVFGGNDQREMGLHHLLDEIDGELKGISEVIYPTKKETFSAKEY